MPDDAGRVHEDRGGVVLLHDLVDAGGEFLLAAEDHVPLFHVGREAVPVHLGAARQAPPDVPRVGGAADGAVDEVDRIRDRVQDHPGPAEDAGPLADGAGKAVVSAVDGCLALSRGHGWSSGVR